VDLLGEYVVNGIKIITYHGDQRYYQYDIEGSLDGINWTPIVDNNSNLNNSTSEGDVFFFNNVNANYLRVNMNFNSANQGVHIVEFEAYGDLLNPLPPIVGPNIALNKPTLNSHPDPEGPSNLAVDGIKNLNNWWGSGPYSQWWQVDLLDSYSLKNIILFNYYDEDRYYQFDIQVSLDLSTWTTIVDNNDNYTTETSRGHTFYLDNIQARYIRVNMNYNSANEGVHIIEFEAYGNSNLSKLENPKTDKFLQDPKADIIDSSYFISASPNPIANSDVSNLVLKLFTPSKTNVSIYIHDMNGRELLNKTFFMEKGFSNIPVSVKKIPNGIIVISTNILNKIESKKIIIN